MDYKQAYNEIESLWKYGERELKENGQGEQLFIPETVNYPTTKVVGLIALC